MGGVTTADYWPHPLTAGGRTLLAVPPGATVGDVVRLARAPGRVDVMLDGQPVARDEWDAPVNGRLVAVRAVAAGDSDARTILQLAILAASIYVGNITALGAWAPYAAAAVSIVGNLIVNALVPPEVPGSEKPPPPLYSLRRGDPAQIAVAEAAWPQVEREQRGAQGLDAGVAEAQRRRALLGDGFGTVQLLERLRSDGAVVADALDVQ